MAKDYYDILGIGRQASSEEIKKAFHKKAHQHHPDKGGDADKFKEINEAYQVLNNADKRRRYDQFGEAAFNGAQGGAHNWGGFSGFQNDGGFQVDFEDLNDIFGGFGDWFGFGGNRSSGRRSAKRGRDLEMSVNLSFSEAVFGTEKEISYTRQGLCQRCQGKGAEPGSELNTCPTCNGRGRVSRLQQTILGNVQMESTCPNCQGKGKIPKTVCRDCHGSGTSKEKVNFKAKIPAGIDDGSSLRLTGKGEILDQGEAGDLYLRIKVAPDKNFNRQGYDIKSEQQINFSQAADGDKIEVLTIHGPVKLKIPAGTPSGAIFRLKDKGISKINGRGQGDHFVLIKIKVPSGLSRKQRQALEEAGL